jgi:peptide-methionine (S)-S-oxide reductase
MMTSNTEDTIIFGAGCFWCIEAAFGELRGVTSVFPGYSGGETTNPTYGSVSNGQTGHAEVIKITYRPIEISLDDLLQVFFTIHNPTELNRQGDDVGNQYRSVIFYHSDDQKLCCDKKIALIEQEKWFNTSVVTQLVPATAFYPAEDMHVNYFARNQEKAYCAFVISPKLNKLRSKYQNLIK